MKNRTESKQKKRNKQGTDPQPSYSGPFSRFLRPAWITRWAYSETPHLQRDTHTHTHIYTHTRSDIAPGLILPVKYSPNNIYFLLLFLLLLLLLLLLLFCIIIIKQ